MMICRPEGTTRTLGKQQGYLGLPVRDIVLECEAAGGEVPAMVTAWEPTPDEIAALAAGAKVYVTIIGQQHPPIVLQVGDPPDSLEDRSAA